MNRHLGGKKYVLRYHYMFHFKLLNIIDVSINNSHERMNKRKEKKNYYKKLYSEFNLQNLF